MSDTLPDHRSAALEIAASIVPLLEEAHLDDLATQFRHIKAAAAAAQEDVLFGIVRALPRFDVADFWHPFEWMPDQLSPDKKALLTAYYNAALEAFTNFRVVAEFGSERAVVDVSPEALRARAADLLKRRAHEI
jgi:hypothetical protein